MMEKFSLLPYATAREKMALRLPLARAHDKAMAARQVAMNAALREAFVERIPADRWSLRSNIIRLVDRGEMSPDQAEAWAATFGWKPLAGWAEPSGLDPMEQKAWSLPMTAAWIRWRAPDEVRRRWSAYIEPSTRWVDVSDKRDGSRHAVRPIEDWGYYEVEDFETDNDPLTSTKRDMLLALSSGRLVASGYRSDGEFVEIPAAQWTALKIVGFCGTDSAPWIRNGIHKVMNPDCERLAFDAVRISREQVLDAFPKVGLDWRAQLESRISANPRYTQELAISEMKQFAADHSINITVEDIKSAWKRIQGIVGKAKSGPKGPRTKKL